MQMLGIPTGAPTSPSLDVEWLLEEAARTAARRDWSRMGLPGEQVAPSLKFRVPVLMRFEPFWKVPCGERFLLFMWGHFLCF